MGHFGFWFLWPPTPGELGECDDEDNDEGNGSNIWPWTERGGPGVFPTPGGTRRVLSAMMWRTPVHGAALKQSVMNSVALVLWAVNPARVCVPHREDVRLFG